MSAHDKPVLEISGVSKRFSRKLASSLRYGLIDALRDLTGMPPRREPGKDEFWALNNASFSLKRGESLGLLGPNGAGKSTLLKIIAGLIKPDRGAVTVRGRVGALIELGAGMHPLLTGRENIRVNAAILGLSQRELSSKMDEIITFADLGDFIDSPVQSYSSGMRVRLGFAVAAHLEPELLLIDEVLAVGDAAFRIKCLNRLREIKNNTAIILVSHSLPDINQFCTRGVLLKKGSGICGTINEITRLYISEIPKDSQKVVTVLKNHISTPASIICENNDIIIPILFDKLPERGSILHFGIKTEQDQWITGSQIEIDTPFRKGSISTSCPLSPGNYIILLGLVDSTGEYLYYAPRQTQLNVPGDSSRQAGPITIPIQLHAIHSP